MSQKPGFTLVEMLLALTLMVMILGSVMFSISYTQKFWGLATSQSERLALMQDLLATITDEVKFASTVSLSGGRLNLGALSFDYHDQKVRRSKGSSTAYLTTEWQIDSLSFSLPSPNPKLIKIALVAKGIKLEAMALCRN